MASKCTKCGDTEYYNFALNIGLCDPCIGERIEELEADAKINQSVCDTIEEEVTKINEELKAQIKGLEETVNLAIDGIDALSNNWPDEQIKKDVMAIKETLKRL